MNIVVSKMLVLLGVVGLTACVPAITTIYETPEVSGQVIDAETFRPVAGAALRFVHPKAKSVISDDQGRFNLEAISSVQATLLMVGHARTSYCINTDYAGASVDVAARATLKMLYLEKISPFFIFVDSAPQNISPAEMEADVTYALLQSASIEGGELSFCDKATRQNAIKVLLIARKVAQSIRRESQANPPGEALANLYRQYLESAYEQVDIQWNELYYTCGGELQSKLAAQAFVRRVQDEFRRSIY